LAALGCLLVDDTYDTDIESLLSESSAMPEMTKSQRIRYLRIWLRFFSSVKLIDVMIRNKSPCKENVL
jgi:hypothetical protein